MEKLDSFYLSICLSVWKSLFKQCMNPRLNYLPSKTPPLVFVFHFFYLFFLIFQCLNGKEWQEDHERDTSDNEAYCFKYHLFSMPGWDQPCKDHVFCQWSLWSWDRVVIPWASCLLLLQFLFIANVSPLPWSDQWC